MSRRNPTKRQRRILNDLMKKGMSYEDACMTLPESKPDPKCLHTGNPDPELTNIPKIKKNAKQKPYTSASTQTGVVQST